MFGMGSLHARQIKGVGKEDFSRKVFNLGRNVAQCDSTQCIMPLFLLPYDAVVALKMLSVLPLNSCFFMVKILTIG